MDRNPLDLLPKEATELCNARTPSGYCRNKAGFGTQHYGNGRCKLHGGIIVWNRPNVDTVLNSIYTKKLPTNLSIELLDLKSSSEFSSLVAELSLLKTFVGSLIKGLPSELSEMFGKPICGNCKTEIVPDGEGFDLLVKSKSNESLKLFKQIISTIESTSRVFERLSKHEINLGKFVTVTELEGILSRWGRILLKYFGDHPNIDQCKREIIQCGWLKDPVTETDFSRLEVIETIRTKAKKTVKKKKGAYRQKDAVHDILVAEKFILDDDVSVSGKKYDAEKILQSVKKRKNELVI